MEKSDSIKPGQVPDPDLEARLGYRFARPELLEQASTHRSYAVEHGLDSMDNERLEFLGDAVLELVISHLLFNRYAEKCREGELTRMRSFLVNEAQLAEQARKLGMGDYLRMGKGEDRSGGREKPSILSNVFEAVVGAIYLDSDIEEVFFFIERCLGDLIDQAADIGASRDFKSQLQEVTQRKFHNIPAYEVENVSGPDHQRTFHIALYLNGRMLARSKGQSKKEAEQEAARKALRIVEGVQT